MSRNYRLPLITGVDIIVPELQLVIHQPSCKELSMTMLDEQDLFFAFGILTANKEKVNTELDNSQLFSATLKNLKSDKRNSVLLVLDLLFPESAINISPSTGALCITQNDKDVFLEGENFDIFQDIVKRIFCIGNKAHSNAPEYNTKSEMANKIKEKILKGREEVEKRKALFGESQTKQGVIDRYISILSIALKLSINEIKEYTLYQLYDNINRFNLFNNFDLDIKVRLAGGDPKSEAEEWTKDIH